MCAKATVTSLPNPTKGSACLVHFFYGDSVWETLAQNIGIELTNFVTSYKKSILLSESTWQSKLFSSSALNKASKIKLPTKENFINEILELVDEGYYLDIYILAHGSKKEKFSVYDKNKSNENYKGWLSKNTIEQELAPKQLGLTKLPIRLVGQWSCWGSYLNSTWRALGALCSFGARQIQYYPQQSNKFIQEWTSGKKLGDAIRYSNTASSRTMSQAFMLLQSAASNEWNGCPGLYNVLSSHRCYKDFYKETYGENSFPSGKSGKEYMNYASTMLREGYTNLKFQKTPSWK